MFFLTSASIPQYRFKRSLIFFDFFCNCLNLLPVCPVGLLLKTQLYTRLYILYSPGAWAPLFIFSAYEAEASDRRDKRIMDSLMRKKRLKRTYEYYYTILAFQEREELEKQQGRIFGLHPGAGYRYTPRHVPRCLAQCVSLHVYESTCHS